MTDVDPAILDTLAFSGLDEETFRARALASRAGLGLFEHDLSFVRYRVVGRDPAKPTLVILPDGPATIESYDGFIEALEARFNISLLEMPGFGFSYPKHGHAMDFEASCQILCSALRSLGLSRMVLVGPCIQGLYAARMAEIMSTELSGVIIAQTGDFAAQNKWAYGALNFEALSKPFDGQIRFRLNREMATIDRWIPFAAGPHAPVVQLQSEARKVQASGCCFGLASQVQKLANGALPDLKLSVPTAILWGLADKSHAQTDRRSSRRYAPAAHYEEWDDVGHFVDIEAPQRLGDIAMALLRTP